MTPAGIGAGGAGYDPLTPPQDEITAPWWEATRSGRLLLQHCPRCGTVQHPPRAVCTGCGAVGAGEWRRVSGRGVVDTCTVVERAPMPGFDPPYVVARVRLEEGPVLLSTVTGVPPYDVRPDTTVGLAWRPLPDGRALPIFRPEEG